MGRSAWKVKPTAGHKICWTPVFSGDVFQRWKNGFQAVSNWLSLHVPFGYWSYLLTLCRFIFLRRQHDCSWEGPCVLPHASSANLPLPNQSPDGGPHCQGSRDKQPWEENPQHPWLSFHLRRWASTDQGERTLQGKPGFDDVVPSGPPS